FSAAMTKVSPSTTRGTPENSVARALDKSICVTEKLINVQSAVFCTNCRRSPTCRRALRNMGPPQTQCLPRTDYHEQLMLRADSRVRRGKIPHNPLDKIPIG